MRSTNSQNINFPIVLRVMGWLLMIEALFMCVPMGISWLYGESQSMRSFLYSVVITLAVGFSMTTFLHPSSLRMQRREGLLLTAVIWVFFSAFGMLPFLFSGTLHSATDAFFETMSGFTTTGSTVIRDIDHTARGILFWRSMTQWIGGMGIILFTLAVLPMLNHKGGIAMFNAEVTGITHDRLHPRVSQSAKFLWSVYLVFSVVMSLLLAMSPMGWFDGVCHTMSTLSTGGFSTNSMGVNHWHDYYSTWVIMAFMFIGGVNFPLIAKVAHAGPKVLLKSDTFKWYVGMVVVTIGIIWLHLLHKGLLNGHAEIALFSAFDTISAITSTGFSTFDYEHTGEFIPFFLMIAMSFGAMAGSTSGAAKIDRMIVLFKNTRNEFYRVLHPNAVTSVHIENRALPHDVVSKVLAFLATYAIVLIAVALFLSMQGVPLLDSLFTSASALGNVGLGYGVTSSGSFALLSNAAKWLLSFEMMIGRLELFTVLVIFTRNFWVKD